MIYDGLNLTLGESFSAPEFVRLEVENKKAAQKP
jgi:hypothetical protein